VRWTGLIAIKTLVSTRRGVDADATGPAAAARRQADRELVNLVVRSTPGFADFIFFDTLCGSVVLVINLGGSRGKLRVVCFGVIFLVYGSFVQKLGEVSKSRESRSQATLCGVSLAVITSCRQLS
jgi:hypothetical protein